MYKDKLTDKFLTISYWEPLKIVDERDSATFKVSLDGPSNINDFQQLTDSLKAFTS